jgi:hypothetical protein
MMKGISQHIQTVMRYSMSADTDMAGSQTRISA